MKQFTPHRNSQKRIYGTGKIYFIVTKTFKNHSHFKETIFCDLLIEELRLCKKLKGFKLFAFSIIYDHLNLLIRPNDEYNISQVMHSIKQNISFSINRVINYQEIIPDNARNFSDNFFEGEEPAPRLQKNYQKNSHDHPQNNNSMSSDNNCSHLTLSRHDTSYFRWNKINKIYEKKGINIKNYIKRFIGKSANPKYDKTTFKWQQSFYDHVIRGKNDFTNHYIYTIGNPAKHKLPTDWPYISTNFPDLIDKF